MTTITPPLQEPDEKLHGKEATSAVRKAFTSPLASVSVVLIAVLWTIPTLGLLINSFRSKEDAATTGWWEFFVHPSFSLDTYRQVLSSNGMTMSLVNSLAITIPGTIIPIFIASMAAYALAWMRFRGSDLIFFGIFALQVVPLQMALVPLQQFYTHGLAFFGVTVLPAPTFLNGTLAQIWVSHAMFSLPLAVFLLHNFIAQIPGSLIEAARMDGAPHLRIFRSIVLPLSMPAIASFAIFQFLWVWNDLLVAKTFGSSDPSKQPVTAHLQTLVGSFGAHQELLAPAGFIAIIIPLIVFLALQRYFARGLLAGSVKG